MASVPAACIAAVPWAPLAVLHAHILSSFGYGRPIRSAVLDANARAGSALACDRVIVPRRGCARDASTAAFVLGWVALPSTSLIVICCCCCFAVNNKHKAVVRYIGATNFAEGLWYGVELEREIGASGAPTGPTNFPRWWWHC